MGWAEEWAAQLRQRDNKAGFSPQIGEVVSASPLQVALQSDAILLDPGQVYLCAALAEGITRQCEITLPDTGGKGALQFSKVLQAGDLVACIPVAGKPGQAQKFLVVDKVVRA